MEQTAITKRLIASLAGRHSKIPLPMQIHPVRTHNSTKAGNRNRLQVNIKHESTLSYYQSIMQSYCYKNNNYICSINYFIPFTLSHEI